MGRNPRFLPSLADRLPTHFPQGASTPGFWRPARQAIDRPASRQEIAHVALLGQSGQFHELDAGGLAVKRLGHLLGVISAGLVIVRDDQAMAAAERLRVMILPLAGAHRVARRESALCAKILNVLLALANPDGLIGVRGQQDRQVIENRLDPVEAPLLALPGIGLPLAEVLRVLEPDGFKYHVAGFVVVLVDPIDLADAGLTARFPVALGVHGLVLSPTLARALEPMA